MCIMFFSIKTKTTLKFIALFLMVEEARQKAEEEEKQRKEREKLEDIERRKLENAVSID